MITKDEVKHIAELARIKLDSDQIEKYQAELSAILDFVGQLLEADTSTVEPIQQVTGLENIFKEDKDRGLIDQSMGGELVKQSPEHKDGFVVVPEVIKKD